MLYKAVGCWGNFMTLKILENTYQIIKLKPTDEIPLDIFNREFYSVTRTEDELSIVADNEIEIKGEDIEKGWKIIKINEKLDFNLTGILSRISGILADNNIGIFAVSTYNTDYILLKARDADRAKNVLTRNGYRFE